jgi:hypothetical protein
VAAPRSAGALWSSSMHRDEQGPDGSVGRSRATTGPGRLSWRQIYGVFFFAPLAPNLWVFSSRLWRHPHAKYAHSRTARRHTHSQHRPAIYSAVVRSAEDCSG